MSNMSYCRFENTLSDLKDCFDALEDAGSASEYIESQMPSWEEAISIKSLLRLCQEMVDEFEQDVDECAPNYHDLLASLKGERK